ncbi:MAG: hypothetical protein BM556_02720 [Bacteriovorax sp. MedPE-SWde]|nr:MAG: hypothetical protein BM556_02720 [Bacteriovorax sp. MedPE-SWde]
MVLLRNLFIAFILIATTSCGQSKEEEADARMVSAENLLTRGQCDEALSKMTSFPARPDDARYVKLLASAYACKAGYTTTSFFTELENTNLGTGADLLSIFTTFTQAQTNTGPLDRDYIYMFKAINTLLFSGTVSTAENPAAAFRAQDFTTEKADEINSFLLFLSFVELGKYFYHYGTTDSTGVKGGAGAAVCMHSYANIANINVVLGAGASGSCTAAGQAGHADLNDGGDIHLERACQGIVLFNNFKDVLLNLTFSSSAIDLSDLIDDINTAFAALLTDVSDSSIAEVRSVSLCEANFATNNNDLQIYFAYIFEILHSR